MYIDTNTIITVASAMTALAAIFSAVFAAHRWFLKQERQDKEIEQINQNSACLRMGYWLA